MKLSQGDSVAIIAGKDKGKKGTVLRVIDSQNRVIVSGVNIVTKHVKKTAQEAGKKLQYEVSLHASNVMIIDPKTGKPARIGHKVDAKTGKKVRIARPSGAELSRTKVAAATGKDAAKNGKKAPFWKKAGFGSGTEAEAVATPEAPLSAPTITRSGGRGS